MNKNCNYGGQALIEGILMLGAKKGAIALRLPNGEIEVSDREMKRLNEKYKFLKLPIIRGFVNFIETMIFGYKSLMYSAEKQIPPEEESEEKESKLSVLVGIVSLLFSLVLTLGLFVYLPSLVVDLIDGKLFSNALIKYHGLFEGIIKILIFLIYLKLVSKQRDIKRVFSYHGAEHKSIFCLENGEELTVENVRKQSRFHPRCGTSFLFIILIISIIISTTVLLIFPSLNEHRAIWILVKLLLIPLITGIGYDVLKFSAKHKSKVLDALVKPGLWIQRITTIEPDDSMIEVAIAALKRAIELNENTVKED
ncbi:MAG: DUF1385 domain-containing protein [Clostridia bacterium]|nr:DUF1385 domain-containing protein [Clostridia bacterium]